MKKLLGKISTKLYNSGLKKLLIAFGLCCLFTAKANIVLQDSIINIVDTANFKVSDSVPLNSLHHLIKFKKSEFQDSLISVVDTACYEDEDTLYLKSLRNPIKNKKSEFDDPVKYSAKDSLFFDMDTRKVYLFGEAEVNYKNINLKAAYIEFDMSNETVYATGPKDSLGNIKDFLIFKEGNQEFKSHWLRYNFKTKKGFSHFVKTQQESGTLIGDSTKRMPDGNINLHGGTYSTCDLDHPHFYIALTKAKAIPGDKIVAGPAYLVIADIPLPIFIPFGFFPNSRNSNSGILFPEWGQNRVQGYYLINGGYYFAVNDYMDLTTRGNIYANGSWGISENLNYKKRYKFSGNFYFNYDVNKNSEQGYPDYSSYRDYAISWVHNQDKKSSPNSDFGALVNMSSVAYDRRNSYDLNSQVTNTKNSSIHYAHYWPNTPFSFSSSFSQNQNSLTKIVDMTLPSMSFNMDRIYPFQRKEFVGKQKWYESFQVTYNAQMENNVSTVDSLVFNKKIFDNMKNGFKHSIVPSISFNLNKFTTLTPSLSYSGVLYTKWVDYEYDSVSINKWTGKKGKIDTTFNTGLKNWQYAYAFTPGISLGMSPKFYGMYIFKNSSVKAIRHVLSPTVSFSFTPDIRKLLPDYYRTYTIPGSGVRTYSKFDNFIYGTPYPPGGKSAGISMALNNRFEMKYKSPNDTSSQDKKFSLLDYLNFSTFYDLIADTCKLQPINMSATTNLFNKFNLSFNSILNPYVLDNNGYKTRYYLINKSHTLVRMTSAAFTLGTSFTSSDTKKKSTENKNPNQQNPVNPRGPYTNLNAEVDYDIPWSLTLNYSWGYYLSKLTKVYNQSVDFNGDLSITKKWKITLNSGYDFTNKAVSPTSVSISGTFIAGRCGLTGYHSDI